MGRLRAVRPLRPRPTPLSLPVPRLNLRPEAGCAFGGFQNCTDCEDGRGQARRPARPRAGTRPARGGRAGGAGAWRPQDTPHHQLGGRAPAEGHSAEGLGGVGGGGRRGGPGCREPGGGGGKGGAGEEGRHTRDKGLRAAAWGRRSADRRRPRHRVPGSGRARGREVRGAEVQR